MITCYVDLVTDNSQIVRIECPRKFEDELHESLTNSMKSGDWWAPSRFEGCRAELNGLHLDRVAMNRIVGML